MLSIDLCIAKALTTSCVQVVFYLSMWYKREERTYRVALFFSAASLAGAFGGILAYVSFSYFRISLQLD